MQIPSPRIFVITARDADAAVIFRRGPSDWFHLLKWDMADDTFQAGAWFKGSMYPEKCDLSPDGALLLYFVLRGSMLQTSYTHAWTAVSRAPWMEALGLWPQGMTYGGGGRFLSNRHIAIRSNDVIPHEDHPGKGLTLELGWSAEQHTSSHEVEGSTWSGRDRAGRLIHAKDGKIFRRPASGLDLELTDLSGMTPDPKPAPQWASRELDEQQTNR
jgi:hypothetical protein